METPQEKGRSFEAEIAKEFGFKQTPASGALWFSKLDILGISSRWSCKFTEKRSFRLTQTDIDEAITACYGPGGDGSIPVWAIRIEEERYDLVLMRKEDFKALIQKDIDITYEASSKADINKKRAAIPILMREEKDGKEDKSI